jgi:tetratricopeptide (TPR) repeat protein
MTCAPAFDATLAPQNAAKRHAGAVVLLLQGLLLASLWSSVSHAQEARRPRGGDDVEQFIEELPTGDPTEKPVADPALVPVAKPSKPTNARPDIGGEPARRAAPSVADDGIVVVKPLSYDGLVERYDALERARTLGDQAQLKRARVVFEEGLVELGLIGRSSFVQAAELALATVVYARAARGEGRHDEARDALELAVELAPDLALVHHERLRVALEAIDPVSAIASLRSLVVAIWTRPDTRVAAALIALVVVLASLVLVLLVIALVGAMRAFRTFAFDVHNGLPRGIARWQIATVLAVLVALPLVAGMGPVVTALVWLLIFGVYFDSRQRTVYGVFLVVVIAMPLLLDGVSRLAGYPFSIEGRSHRALLELGDDEGRDRLAKEPQDALPVEGLMALAEDALREGRIDEAKELLRVVVNRANHAAFAHNNLGVIAALEGNLELADAAFKDALSRDPTLFESLFNRTLVAARGGKQKTLDVTGDMLAALDADTNERLRRLTYRGADEKVSQNRAYAWAALPMPAVLPTLRVENDESRARFQEMADVFLLGMPSRVASIAFAIVLALFMLIGRFVKKLQPSTPCLRCGAPSGRRYDGPSVPTGTCSACYHAFVRKDGTLDAGMRVLKERQGVTYKRRVRFLTRALAVVVPGGGHHIAGAPLRATVGTFVVTALAIVALFSPMLMLLWPSLHLAGLEPVRLVAGALAVVVHAALVWDAFRMTE